MKEFVTSERGKGDKEWSAERKKCCLYKRKYRLWKWEHSKSKETTGLLASLKRLRDEQLRPLKLKSTPARELKVRKELELKLAHSLRLQVTVEQRRLSPCLRLWLLKVKCPLRESLRLLVQHVVARPTWHVDKLYEE